MSNTLHKISDALRAFGRPQKSAFTSAVIVAGGSGTRFSDGDNSVTKQFTGLGGLPVVVRTLLVFENCPDVDEIVVAAKEDEVGAYAEIREKYKITKLASVTPGGSTRQESVLKAFAHISDKAQFVAIHDAARCCVTGEMISSVIGEAVKYGAAAAGKRVCDTVKVENGKGFTESTVDRNLVWLVSTPQVFKTELYRACSFAAKRDGISVTDDCGLLEAQGFSVRLVDVGEENIKITTKGDLARAEDILARRSADKVKEENK